MGDLYSRLQEIKKRKQNGPTQEQAVSTGRAGEDAPDRQADRSPGAEWTRISPGVYERSRVYPLTEGSFPFDLDDEGRWYGVSSLIGPFSGVRPVFLDVETSGLSGGAGSTAFLIGLGFLSYAESNHRTSGASGPSGASGSRQDPAITVYQLFLSEPAAEPALLSRYAELVGDPDTACYVTYNGASFDLPVLRTRHIMNRRRLPEALHWDLLPLTRRLYAPAIGSCTLGRVEQQVLGVGREDDVPGSEVPARYHRFVDSGDYQEISPVLSHHYYDVAHLAILAANFQEILGNRPTTWERVAHDRIALARFLLQRGRRSELPRCAALLDEVIEETERRRRHVTAAARAGGFAARLTQRPPRAWSVSRELRALVARRLEQPEKLRTIRRTLWEVRGSRHDAVELAKVLEHRFKDHSGALAVVELWREGAGADDSELEHRAGRLRRKIDRWKSFEDQSIGRW